MASITHYLATPVVVGILLLGAASAPGHAATNWIQPGDQHDGSCTLNFVFDGTGSNAGRVFIGTAAHCVTHVGQSVSATGFADFGEVAWLGDEYRTAWDFAMIEVDPSYHSSVNAAVKGHPEFPTGVTAPSDTWFGDLVQISGYGLGYGWTQYTQENRQATFQFDDDTVYSLTGPIHWGDSGGPLVHIDSGKALGIVSRLCSEEYIGCSEEGPTVQGIIDKLDADGFPVELRTV